MIGALRRKLSRTGLLRLQKALGWPARVFEAIVFGTALREWALVHFLAAYYHSLYRRIYLYAVEAPHFTHQRLGFFFFAFADHPPAFASFNRAVLSAEVIRLGDRVLDIGCGDGFFTKRFLANGARHVDGVDVEPSAIAAAEKGNRAPNVKFHRMDAVNEPFPSAPYDVIVWDGALGHFSPDTTDKMLQKISAALADDGAFTGSESLGHEGTDHLQFFGSRDDLRSLFSRFFSNVEIKTSEYTLGDGFIRSEAYWRCANDPARLNAVAWQRGRTKG